MTDIYRHTRNIYVNPPFSERVIYKYTLDQARMILSMPRGAIVLSVGVQNGVICLWVLVEPLAEFTQRAFRWYGTGQPIDEYGRYIGTVQVSGLGFVWHVFEVLV